MKVRDQISFVEPRTVLEASYGALSSIQTERPGVQVMAVAVLFKTLADELKLDVSELMNQASRIATDDDTPYRANVRALREYVKGELKK